MKAKELLKLGFPEGPAIGIALRAAQQFPPDIPHESIEQQLKKVLEEPAAFVEHPQLGELAELLAHKREEPKFVERDSPAPYQIWGQGLEQGALEQMRQSVRLPVAVQGALMPDAHQGYGLPIGGVLATEKAVIPYAVGVDIACRMKLTVFDVPAADLDRLEDQLTRTLNRETNFGTGGHLPKAGAARCARRSTLERHAVDPPALPQGARATRHQRLR